MDDYLPIHILARRFRKTEAHVRRAIVSHGKHVRKMKMDAEAFDYVTKNSALINCYHVDDVRNVLLFYNGTQNAGRGRR